MKAILCYGDSLTWGYNAVTGTRHAFKDRWPSVLKAGLGDTAHVIAEGLNGRTTIFDDWASGTDRKGSRILPTVLASHSPLDLVIVMLGSNDMKPTVCGHAHGTRQGMERLISIIRRHDYGADVSSPQILIVAPPKLCSSTNTNYAGVFEGAIVESAQLSALYEQMSKLMQCGFFDAGAVAQTTSVDGVHLDAENTRAIGKGILPIVRSMLGLSELPDRVEK